MSDPRDRLESLFHELVELDDADRASRLEELSRADRALARELKHLLAADTASDDLVGAAAAPDSDVSRTIGPYRLVRVLGEGGMGVVWEARQATPVRRTVALKLLSVDRLTPRTLERFEAERQALASLDHPHIATLYDSGTTTRGEPWFAMELIVGDPITTYCDCHALSLGARLELFATLCEAVQHAHRRGLIHRDLKPSNVLVASPVEHAAGSAEPHAARLRVIDFGIAKALLPDTAARDRTRAGDVVGTPEYMSPEQAGHEDGVVDTRTDVYALGVILYELLVGELPIGAERLRRAGLDEMRRVIREDDAPRPSSRIVETRSERTTEIARSRSTEPGMLLRALRGDLDWIVLKALAKSKARRYESPLDLAEDLQRFREGDPVVAGPPTRRYRLGKWIRKHRAAALVLLVVTATLVAGATAVTLALLRAQAAERVARLEAEQERATRVFLIDLFEAADPFERDPWSGSTSTGQTSPGGEPSARDLVDRGARRLLDESDASPAFDPVTRARLQVTIGALYDRLAEDDDAERLIRAALETLEASEGRTSSDASSGTSSGSARDVERTETRLLALLALGETALSASDAEAAEGIFNDALELVERIPATTEVTLTEARARAGLAEALRVLVRYDEGLEQALGAVDLARAAAKRDPAERASSVYESSLAVLAALQAARGDADEAVATYETLARAQEERLGPEHPRLATTYRGLSHALEVAGDYAAGAEVAERALERSRAALGDVHPVVAYDLVQVAAGMRVHGRHADAVAPLREAETILRTTRPESAALATTLAELGMSLEETGRADEAAAAHGESVRLLEGLYGADYPDLAPALSRWSSALRASGRVDEAVPHARRAVRIARSAHPDGHWRVVVALAELTQAMLAAGDLSEALERSDELVSTARTVFGLEHVMVGAVSTIRAEVLVRGAVETAAEGDRPALLDRAADDLSTAREIFLTSQGPESPNLAHVAEQEAALEAARAELSTSSPR